MLVNFPFIPETEETVTQWYSNLRKSKVSEEEITKMELNVNYHIPDNLTTEHSGLIDNTGLYYPKLLHSYQSVSLEPGYKIDSYFSFLPVLLIENKIDHDTEYCEPVELPEGRYQEQEDVYKVQEELLMSTYGFVLSIDDFMNLIGEQLKQSKREFAVAFYWVDYHEEVFHKSGRLYHPDHSAVKLNKENKLISFHIFELLNKQDREIKRTQKLPFMGYVFSLEIDEAKKVIDNIHDEVFINSLNLDRDDN